MGCLAIYLDLQFLSLLFCNFHCRSPSFPWLFPSCFILLDGIVNGITFLVSFLGHSLLVYRNTTGICVLILYITNLPNLFIVCLMGSMGFFTYITMSSARRGKFASSLPIWIAFIFFLLLNCYGYDF